MITENIYTSNDGTTWSMITDWLNVPAERMIPADLAVTRALMGLTNDRLDTAMDEIQKDMEAGQIMNAFDKFAQLRRRIKDIPDEALLQDIACVFALLPDEDPHDFKPSLNARKLQIWRRDEDCRFFFIVKVVNYITTLSGISEVAIRTAILQRNLLELSNQNGSIFPLAETGLMSS